MIIIKWGKVGKLRVGFIYNYGIVVFIVILEMINVVEYVILMNEIDKYVGNKGCYMVDDFRLYVDGFDFWGYLDMDWFNEILKLWFL